MKTYKNLYKKVYDKKNLILAWKKARKGKTKKCYVLDFENDLRRNILKLHFELQEECYKPLPLEDFILKDPKTRKISKANFRDRIVHHAIINIIQQLFEKSFIYDSCANQKGKGNLFAIKRFYKYFRKVSENGKINGWYNKNQVKGYCFKADIKHYFQEVDHDILLEILSKKILDKKVICLIKKILENYKSGLNNSKGMPLGNLTSQFFANVYLNELDYFVKNSLKVKYYIRYVDDFIILDNSKDKLEKFQEKISAFLDENLKLELHPDKSRIIPLSRGVDFVGFRNFYYFKLLRKRNIKKMKLKISLYQENRINSEKFEEIFQGWKAYANLANSYSLINEIESSLFSFQN